MNAARMPDSDLYERYFADCPLAEQAALFHNLEEVREYVNHQIAEHYPEDLSLRETVARRLWEILSGIPRWKPGESAVDPQEGWR